MTFAVGQKGKNMRLIDKDALKADIEQFNRPLCDDYHMKDYVLNQIITDIENQPTVDAVPIIRCRECLRKRYCSFYRETNDENGFCSWAEGKEE